MSNQKIFSCHFYRVFALLGFLGLLCLHSLVIGQQTTVIRKIDFGQYNQIFLDDSLWHFLPGELPKNKSLFTTTGWDTMHHTIFGKTNAPSRWKGMGWFGLWVRVDTSLVNKKLFICINHDGASELFLDGKPLGGYGKVGHSTQEMQAIRAPKELIPVWFADTCLHLLTLRYSNFFGVYSDFLGFQLSIGDYAKRIEKTTADKTLLEYLPMFAAAQLILSLIHFLFYIFYPKQKLNIYYALFVLLIGINGLAVYQFYMTPYPSVQYIADFIATSCKVLIMSMAVILLYELNYKRVPRWRLVVLTGVTVFYLSGYILKFWILKEETWDNYFSLTYVVCMLDGLWSVVRVIKRGQKDAWLIAVGVSAIILVYIFAWDDTFHVWPYGLNSMRLFVMGAGSLVLPICLSHYLALDFSRINQKLTSKLREVETLSAQSLAHETEKTELITSEAKRLEQIVQVRTAELKKQADKLMEMDELKSHFFTNIAHELKTPLTLIMNPAKELLSNPQVHTHRNLKLIINNTERLLQLINQLLDLSKIESGMMEVRLEPLDLVLLIKTHVYSFGSVALQKDISLHLTTEMEVLWILTDRDKMDKIILNILTNAIKFTDKGKIEVVLSKIGNPPAFTLSVRDTGIGIPSNKLPYIFTRFYQVEHSETRSAEGTGIGLALTKELVELMGGQIVVESVLDFYTQVMINMPYEAVNPIYGPYPDLLSGKIFNTETKRNELLVGDQSRTLFPLILLIEDHLELMEFIRQSLNSKYRILTATDGEEGIALGLKHIPSLIITDLMMPKVSGYQVTETLKQDERTSHIPVIIITAKSDVDSRILGIETGADAYLAKPFEQRELLALINNLISIRQQLQRQYSHQDLWLNNPLTLPLIEQDFISKIRKAVESHLNEEGYSADQLATDMGLSRTQLHRKLKGLIGQAPGELIRVVRLQYAHDLLTRGLATVSEVAFQVGFASPASFSASFSRHFGIVPSKVAGVDVKYNS